MRDAVLLCVARRALGVRAHDGDGFAAVGAERLDHVLGRDCAGADQSPTKAGHDWILLQQNSKFRTMRE